MPRVVGGAQQLVGQAEFGHGGGQVGGVVPQPVDVAPSAEGLVEPGPFVALRGVEQRGRDPGSGPCLVVVLAVSRVQFSAFVQAGQAHEPHVDLQSGVPCALEKPAARDPREGALRIHEHLDRGSRSLRRRSRVKLRLSCRRCAHASKIFPRKGSGKGADIDTSDTVAAAVAEWHGRMRGCALDASPMLVVGRVQRLWAFWDGMLRVPFAAAGLLPGDFDVLAALRRRDAPMTPADIARSTLVTAGATTKRVDRLVAAGLADRAGRSSDRRLRLVTLTPAGADLVDRLMHQHLANEDALLAPLDPGERDLLADLLRRLLEYAEEQARSDRQGAAPCPLPTSSSST